MSEGDLRAKSITIEDDDGNPVLYLGAIGKPPEVAASINLFGNSRESISLQTNPDGNSEICLSGRDGDPTLRMVVNEKGLVSIMFRGGMKKGCNYIQIDPDLPPNKADEKTTP